MKKNKNSGNTRHLLKKLLSPKLWRKITSVLLAITVFLTTYMMILPALTIDLDTVVNEPGMDVAGAEDNLDIPVSDDSGGFTASVGESQTLMENELSESAEGALSGSSVYFAEELLPVSDMPAEMIDTGYTDETLQGDIDITASDNVDSFIPSEEPEEVSYEGEILPEYDMADNEEIPELEITEEDASPEMFDDGLFLTEEPGEETTEAFDENAEAATEILPVDEQESIDDATEPAEFLIDSAEGEEGVAEETADEENNAEDPLPAHVLKAEGEDYRVTVSFGDEAEIPDGSELLVTEILSDEWDYDQYVNEASEALSTEKRIMSVENARFFDITIIKENEPVEPKAPVTVLVELADSFAAEESAAVVHYTEDEVKVVETVDPEEASASIEEAEAADAAAAQAQAASEEMITSEPAAEMMNDSVESVPADDFGVEESYEGIVEEELSGLEEEPSFEGEPVAYAEEEPFFEGEPAAYAEEVPFAGSEPAAYAEEVPFVGAEPEEVEETDEEIIFAEPMNQIAFVADSFSVYGFVTATLEKTILASDGHNYKVTVTCGADAGIPEDAELSVEEIMQDSPEYVAYVENAENVLGNGEKRIEYVRLFDIKIVDAFDDTVKYQPAEGSQVDVRIELADTSNKDLSVVHFGEAEPMGEILDAGTGEGEEGSVVEFKTDGFSVFAVAYTVDFSYEVNGKTYEFSIPGGGFVRLSDLVEVLGIGTVMNSSDSAAEAVGIEEEPAVPENQDPVQMAEEEAIPVSIGTEEGGIGEEAQDIVNEAAGSDAVDTLDDAVVSEAADTLDDAPVSDTMDTLNEVEASEAADTFDDAAGSEVTDIFNEVAAFSGPLTLNDIVVSDATRMFVADVVNVEFSTPELVWVDKVDELTTIGGIKSSRGLECEYSAGLTEDQIAEINNSTVEAGDWVLISMHPFTSEETLTVTMKNGEVFTIRVTDAQIRKTVIDAKGDTWEITVTYDEKAQIPDNAELKVREILPEDEEYQDYYRQSLEKVGVVSVNAEEAEADNGAAADTDEQAGETAASDDSYAHIFDIQIWADGAEIQPASDVSVSIKLLDAPEEDDTDLQVVHFGKAGLEVMELAGGDEAQAEDEAAELRFVTDEFSVYSVVKVNNGTNLVSGGPYAFVTGIANDPGATTGYGETWGRDYFTIIANAASMTTDPVTYNGNNVAFHSEAVHAWTDGTNNYVGGDIPQAWYFENAGNNQYYIYTKQGNTKYYIDQHYGNSDSTSLSTQYKTAFTVDRNSDGTVCIHNGSWYLGNNGNGEWSNRDFRFTLNADSSKPCFRFRLCKQAEGFDSFAARKVSAKDLTANDNFIIYRKFVDEKGNEQLYALASDGTFVRVYDGGDSVYWRETDKNIYWNYLKDGNSYSIFSTKKNPATDQMETVFLNPVDTTGQTIASEATKLRLAGKDAGEYGTKIENWDQTAYDYAGLHVTLNNAGTPELSSGTAKAGTSDEFLFAVGSSMPAASKSETVATVDSESLGIHITVFDYGRDDYEYAAGDKLSGMTTAVGTGSDAYTPHEAHALVKPYLENGLPSGTNGAMTGLFTEGGSQVKYAQSGVTKLFLKSYYDENGMFRYRSEDNYAYLGKGGNTEFTVYRHAATPYTTDTSPGHSYYYHGHYMPFNDIDVTQHVGRLMNQYGNEYTDGNIVGQLPIGDGRSYEEIYGTTGIPNFFTGMKMEASFSQPRNGKLENGDDMIFKFTGDDDMWVYIDGVLVLDVGGIHEPLSGTINFRTGEVTNPTGSSLAGSSNLKTILTNALNTLKALPNPTEEQRKQIEKLESIEWKGNTFADYTNHDFKAFYMERGAGASNLDLQFNLKVVLTKQFTVEKELPDDIDTRFVNQKYRFRATFIDDTDGNKEKPLYKGAKKADGTTVVCDKIFYQGYTTDTGGVDDTHEVEVDEDGYFYLKAGEVAAFHMTDESIKYNVREVDVDQYNLERITINGEDSEHVNINDDPTLVVENEAEAGEEAVADRSSLLFTNFPKRQSLKITKHILGSAPEDTFPVFEFHVYLETTVIEKSTEPGHEGEDVEVHKLVPYSRGPYYLTKEVEGQTHYFQLTGTNDKGWKNLPVDVGTDPVVCSETGSSGSINSIPPEYTIVIPDLIIGTHFYLVERLDNLPEGCSYVRETLTEGTYDSKTLDPVVIDKVLADDEVEVANTYDPETIGKIKTGVDAESHIYNRYGIEATKEWQDVDGNTKSGGNPLWPANVTFKLRKRIVASDGEVSYEDVSWPAYYNQPAHTSEQWSDTITVNSPTVEANWSHLDTLPEGQSYVVIEHAIAGVAEEDIVRDEKSGAIKYFKLNGKVYIAIDSELGEEGGKVINKEVKLTDIEVEKEWNPAEGLEPGSSTMVLYQVIGQKEPEQGEVDPAQPSEDNMRVQINVNKVDESGDPAVVSDSAFVTVSYTGTDKDGGAVSGTYTFNNTNGWAHTFEIPRYSTVDFTYTKDGVRVTDLNPVKTDGVDSSRTIDVTATVIPSGPRTYTFTVPEELRAGLPENGRILVSVPSASDTTPQYADSTNNWTVSFTVPDEANVEYTVEPGNGFISSVTTSGKASGEPATQNETIEMTPTTAAIQIENIPVRVDWTGEDVPAGTNVVVTFTPDKAGVDPQTVTLNGSEATPWNTTETLQRLDANGDLITWTVTAAKGAGTAGKVSVASVPSTGATISDTAGSGVVVDGSVGKETMTVPVAIDWGNETPDTGTNVRVTFTSDKAGVTADPVNLTAENVGTGADAHKWMSTVTLPRIDSNGDLISWTAAAEVTAPSGATASVPATSITGIKDSNGDGAADKSAEWTGTVARGMTVTFRITNGYNTSSVDIMNYQPDNPYNKRGSTKYATVTIPGSTTDLEVKDSNNNAIGYIFNLKQVHKDGTGIPYSVKVRTNASEAGYVNDYGDCIWFYGQPGNVIFDIQVQNPGSSVTVEKITDGTLNATRSTASTMSANNRKLTAKSPTMPRRAAASPTQTFADTNVPVNGSGIPFTVIRYKDLPKGATVVPKDGKDHNGQQTIDGNDTFKWEDLPTVDADGNPIYYYVVEKDATAQADTISVEYQYEYNADGTIKKVKVINSTTGTPTPTTGSVKVTKAFSGIDSLPNGFKITATYNDGQDRTVVLTTSTQGMTGTGTSTDPYTWELTDLPLDTVVTFTESGYGKTGYTVTTTPAAVNSVVSATATVVTDPTVANGGVAEFTNTYEQLLTTFGVKKEWVNSDNNTPPTGATITATLYKGSSVATATTEVSSIVLNGTADYDGTQHVEGEPENANAYEDSAWHATWKNLLMYDTDGNEIVYIVKESVTYNGYTVSYEKLSGADKDYALDGETITNSKSNYSFDLLKVEEGTTKTLPGASFTIQKVDAENTTASVTYVGGTSPSNPETTGSDGKVSFNNIAHGYYEVKETKAPDGYIITGDAAFYVKIEATGVKLLEKEVKDGKLSFKEATSTKVGNVTIGTQGTTVTFTVENTKGPALPNTGGPGTRALYLLGIMLTTLAGAGLVMKSKKWCQVP